MFRVYVLLVDILIKVRRVLNWVIVDQDQSSKHLTKNTSFDILNLVDYLHQSRSTLLGGPIDGKIYFSENLMPNLLEDGRKCFMHTVESYNELVKKNEAPATVVNENEVFGKANSSIQFPIKLI